ncbi:carbohydrate ABC transporter permease [Gynuella sunshinyii]|uniref:Maltose/maltodextrin transport system permease protein MalG n=1 Tax=Gynuella sunshinyii YC6258 TaxID=1445510 RepID=A0A0C5UZC6_9GAMM|nr:carbohydrate ABC transporter permease [Gynuella sunshinyii]AJQ92675.1 ABC-type sugar transport system, permease component [Gynuella sunshinyii YC6258]
MRSAKLPFVILSILSVPLALMYLYLLIDTFTISEPGSLMPRGFTLEHWRFLWQDLPGRANIWQVTLNTIIFATITTTLVLLLSSSAAYALSRLNIPGRRILLGGAMVLHAFPSVTLLIAIFLILQYVGLYDTIAGVVIIKASLELPLGIWILKGFYDTVPWEIEMAAIQDGASRFYTWRKIVLPQIKPALAALAIFSFLASWSEYILPQVLAPGNHAQVLSVYLAGLIADDSHFDMALFKSVGLFYVLPVFALFLIFQKQLMNMYGGGTKG